MREIAIGVLIAMPILLLITGVWVGFCGYFKKNPFHALFELFNLQLSFWAKVGAFAGVAALCAVFFSGVDVLDLFKILFVLIVLSLPVLLIVVVVRFLEKEFGGRFCVGIFVAWVGLVFLLTMFDPMGFYAMYAKILTENGRQPDHAGLEHLLASTVGYVIVSSPVPLITFAMKYAFAKK